jgi:hypothetical protein
MWRDPVDGELAFRIDGSDDRAILRRSTLYHLTGDA